MRISFCIYILNRNLLKRSLPLLLCRQFDYLFCFPFHQARVFFIVLADHIVAQRLQNDLDTIRMIFLFKIYVPGFLNFKRLEIIIDIIEDNRIRFYKGICILTCRGCAILNL